MLELLHLSRARTRVLTQFVQQLGQFAQYLRWTGLQSDNVLLCLMCEDYRIHSKRWIKALLVSLACIATTSPWAACCLERTNLLRNSASVIFSLYTEESCVAGHASIANPYSQKGASRNVHPHYAGLSERCFEYLLFP